MKHATLSVRLVLLLNVLSLGGAFVFSWPTLAAAQTEGSSDGSADTTDEQGPGPEGDSTPDAADDGADADADGPDTDGADVGTGEPVDGATAVGGELEAAGAAEALGDSVGNDDGAPIDAETSTDEPDSTGAADAGPSQLGAPEPSTAEGEGGEAEAGAESEEAPAAEELPWRNTFFTWTHGVTFNSFLRDAQLSYNPTYLQNFSLSPRWYVLPTSFFWANIGIQLEITDTDGAALNRDPQLSDAALEFRHMMPWEGFLFIGQMRLAFPTSKASLAAQRYVQAGLGMTIVRPIPEIGLTLAGLLSYRRWFAGSNVVQVGEPQPDRCFAPLPSSTGTLSAPEVNTTTCDQLGTASAASDVFLGGIAATWVPFAGFNVALSTFLFTTYGFELAPAYVHVDTSEEPLLIEDGSPSHWNNFTFFSLSVGYQFLPWLNVSLGIQNSGFVASAFNPDGSIRNPLFTPDTQVFLSGTFQIDTIFNELMGEGDDLSPEERQRRRQGLASGPSTEGTF